ncbi:MAG TPA: DUF2255 family protein [Myxococcota bacterium]|nr:DUF2255 family protein [Myxococcota bacterium]
MLRSVSLACAVFAVAAAAAAAEPDWNALAGEREIVVLSENPDGSPHETTVWLAVTGAQGFIRTGNTRWYPNLERKPEISVRIAGVEYPVRAELVTDPALEKAVIDAFAAKYGWSDTMVAWFFPGHPHIVKLAPRAP